MNATPNAARRPMVSTRAAAPAIRRSPENAAESALGSAGPPVAWLLQHSPGNVDRSPAPLSGPANSARCLHTRVVVSRPDARRRAVLAAPPVRLHDRLSLPVPAAHDGAGAAHRGHEISGARAARSGLGRCRALLDPASRD